MHDPVLHIDRKFNLLALECVRADRRIQKYLCFCAECMRPSGALNVENTGRLVCSDEDEAFDVELYSWMQRCFNVV